MVVRQSLDCDFNPGIREREESMCALSTISNCWWKKLGCIKLCKEWEKPPINWCRISSINSIIAVQRCLTPHIRTYLETHRKNARIVAIEVCQTNVHVLAAFLQHVNILSVNVNIIHCLNVDMYVCLILEPARDRHRYCLVISNRNNLQSPSQQNPFAKNVDTFECHRILVSLEITAFSNAPHQVSKEVQHPNLHLESRPYAKCAEGVVSASFVIGLRSDGLEGSKINVGNLCPLNKVGEVFPPQVNYNEAFVYGEYKISKLSTDFHAPPFQ